MVRILKAEFLLGSDRPSLAPSFSLPEVALIGRSNSGKSTLVNRLSARKSLARTSAEPGRTRQYNFFKITLEVDGSREEIVLADLPGYGYARFSKTERERLSRETVNYIKSRNDLVLVCLTCDVRRRPEVEETELINLMRGLSRGFLVFLTKADKLNRSERQVITKKKAAEFGLSEESFVLSGVDSRAQELWEKILPGF